MSRSMAVLAAMLALAGCARDLDFSRERAISTDIDASRYRGASSLYPGMNERSEPLGVFPWQFDDAHPTQR
jgi:hypothetical protein